MNGFTLSLLLAIIFWWSIVISSVDDNVILSNLAPQTTQKIQIDEYQNDLKAGVRYVINKTSNIVNYSQNNFYSEDLKKICHAQVNQFIWKCPTSSSSDNFEKILKFRTIKNQIHFSTLTWYLKSINDIDIIEMDPRSYRHQIQFYVKVFQKQITLARLYPTYPEISGFDILQFIAQLAFQCKFSIHVFDASDVSTVYSSLYGKSYYEYHFKGGIDLNQNFLFKNIAIKNKTTFLNCFEEKIKSNVKSEFESLPQLFLQNIQACENSFVSVEFCPMTFETHRFFYKNLFQKCIDWSPIGGFPDMPILRSYSFQITLEDISRILKKKKRQSISNSDVNFVKIIDTKQINMKTYDEIKTQIYDTSFLMKLFSQIFELCFFQLEKRKLNPNPEDIFKLFLRPCVIPNINLFLKYYDPK